MATLEELSKAMKDAKKSNLLKYHIANPEKLSFCGKNSKDGPKRISEDQAESMIVGRNRYVLICGTCEKSFMKGKAK